MRETPGAFVVSNVGVDVTAASTAGAQEQAFAEGRRLAFAALLAQLGVRRDQIDAASMSDAALSRLTRGFSVEEESTSSGRYRARLSYIFNPDAVRELLSERAVTTLEEESLPFGADRADGAPAAAGAPVLVIPVLREGGDRPAVGQPQPLAPDAWQNVDGGDRVVVPYGELQDVADVSVGSALRGDGAAFRGIVGRYGAGDTVVAVAQETGGGLSVSLTRYAGAGPGATQIVSVPGTDYAAAVREALSALDRPAPGQPAVDRGQPRRDADHVRTGGRRPAAAGRPAGRRDGRAGAVLPAGRMVPDPPAAGRGRQCRRRPGGQSVGRRGGAAPPVRGRRGRAARRTGGPGSSTWPAGRPVRFCGSPARRSRRPAMAGAKRTAPGPAAQPDQPGRLVVAPIAVWLVLVDERGAAFWIFCRGPGVSDGIDGALARWLKARTPLGAWLDPDRRQGPAGSGCSCPWAGSRRCRIWVVVLAVCRAISSSSAGFWC